MPICEKCERDVAKVSGLNMCPDCEKENTGGAEAKGSKKFKCILCKTPCQKEEKYGQMVWVCPSCHTEYNKLGEFIHLPWYREPTTKEFDSIERPNGVELFKEVIQYISDNVVLPADIHYLILALWICSTYRMQDFETTGYIGFYGAGNEKGKTRGLKVINEICYRGVLVAKPTRPFVTKCLSDGATVMIDQAEHTFFIEKTRTDIYDIWTSGYQRDIPLGQLSSTDHISYNPKGTFGAKAISMQEDGRTDNPLNMRTHPFYMQKGTPKNKKLDKVTSVGLRLKLHKYFTPNLDLYNAAKKAGLLKNDVLRYNEKSFLRDRVGEICDPLIFTARMLGLSEQVIERVYLYAIGLMYDKTEETNETFPARIVNTITELIACDQHELMPSDIATKMQEMFKDSDEAKWYTASRVGSMMKKFGFKKSGRRNNGVFYEIMYDKDNNEVYQKIIKQYHPDDLADEVKNIKQEIAKKHEAEGSTPGKINFDGELDQQLIKLLKYREWLESKERQDVKNSWVGVEYDESFAPTEDEQQTEEDEPGDEQPMVEEHQCPNCKIVVLPGLEPTLCPSCEEILKNIK